MLKKADKLRWKCGIDMRRVVKSSKMKKVNDIRVGDKFYVGGEEFEKIAQHESGKFYNGKRTRDGKLWQFSGEEKVEKW